MSDGAVQIIWLPIILLGSLFEALGRATLQTERIASDALQRAVREGLDPLFRIPTDSPRAPPAQSMSTAPLPYYDDRSREDRFSDDRISPNQPGRWADASPAGSLPPEDRTMADTNLNDDMVKLVQYSIVSIKRRDERILTQALDPDGQLGRPLLYLETDKITGDGFSNARIADWVKDHSEEAKEIDLDSMRVYYDVVARWPRSSLKYEEERLDLEDEKIELLKDIAGKQQ